MSTTTLAWGSAAAVSLTLSMLYLFVWLLERPKLRHLLFGLAALGAAGNAVCELAMLKAGSVDAYVTAIKISHVFIFMLLVGLAWFVALYLSAARRYLAAAITVCWCVILVKNFASPYGINFSDIERLRAVTFPWGETFSLAAGTSSLWRLLADASVLGMIVYVLDATIRSWRRGMRRGTLAVGISITAFFTAAGIHSALVDIGALMTPYMVSFAFMGIILVMGLQLSSDVVHASRLSREVRSNERRWRTLLENVHLLVVGLKPDGTATYVNPHVLEITGFEGKEIVGRNWLTRMVKEEDRESTLEAFESFTRGAEFPQYRNRILTRAGGEVIVDWSNVLLLDSEDRVTGTLHIGTDMTGQEAAFREVERLKEQLEEENIYLRETAARYEDHREIVRESDELRYVLSRVAQVAPTDTHVLIEGETGVGKELVARAVHEASPRSEYPLIKVNCAAIPATLIESELFGHVRGAFTGADRDRKGRFQLAHGGTIFLDEIGELPLELQPKLLRVLESGEFYPVGASATVKVDARIIATTNRELKKEIAAGRFRDDLYHRLSAYPITIPPLRKRRSDIAPLVRVFTERFARKLGKQIDQVPKSVMDSLHAYDWPGNVRELRNVVERAVINTRGPRLRLGDDLKTEEPAESGAGSDFILTLEEVERAHIETVLRRCNWRIEGSSGAARILSMNPSTLRNRIRKLRIERPA